MAEPKFGKLKLSAQNTNNGSGFDIFYEFSKNHEFVEGTAKKNFYFIQPWMQFPAKEYTDECMRVSIELVHRFNTYEDLLQENQRLRDYFESQKEDKNG